MVPSPLALSTIRSAFCLDATCMISSAGSPILQNGSAVNPAWIRWSSVHDLTARGVSMGIVVDVEGEGNGLVFEAQEKVA